VNVSADAARRFFVARQLLAPARSIEGGTDGVLEVFRRLGSVQFDTIAVAGRNHELVLHARVADYDPAWLEELLYDRRELFEGYSKGLSLLPTSELPWYRVPWWSVNAPPSWPRTPRWPSRCSTGFAPRRVDGFVDAMRAAHRAYLRFAGASRLEWAPHLDKEKRLFRSRP
jgi:Winged helix DNA-binding domain